MERRTVQFRELRMSGDGQKIQGYAATFNVEAQLPGFTEVIRPGAFDRALREKQDVVCLFNHDANHVLGRTTSGTLRLQQDRKGLYFTCDLPGTQAARDLHESIKRGDINGCSFAFTLPHDGGHTWTEQSGGVLRELTDLDLHDVSPVTYPCYENTSVDARTAAQAAEVRSRILVPHKREFWFPSIFDLRRKEDRRAARLKRKQEQANQRRRRNLLLEL